MGLVHRGAIPALALAVPLLLSILSARWSTRRERALYPGTALGTAGPPLRVEGGGRLAIEAGPVFPAHQLQK